MSWKTAPLSTLCVKGKDGTPVSKKACTHMENKNTTLCTFYITGKENRKASFYAQSSMMLHQGYISKVRVNTG